jgi:heptosyltransferase-2
MGKRKLILRLSSLGDVILATAALDLNCHDISKDHSTDVDQVDWVVAAEWKHLLEGHPGIHKIWGYERAQGFVGFIQMCRELHQENYYFVYDLHGSLRTRLMRFLFCFWSLRSWKFPPLWKKAPKERVRLYGYFTFKKFWPEKWKPRPWVQKYSQVVLGHPAGRPDFSHLLRTEPLPAEIVVGTKYLALMPSSRWDGKKWPVSYFIDLAKRISLSRDKSGDPVVPLILGTSKDAESLELTKELTHLKIHHISGVGQWNLRQTAQVLAHSQGYIGADTGLAHLSESVGTRATVLFGPTAPDLGFGPWRDESQSLGDSLWCRPCGKDGSACFRITQKFLCLKNLSPEKVFHSLEDYKN